MASNERPNASSQTKKNWTYAGSVANSSMEYDDICLVVERIIRGEAATLITGHAEVVARVIVSTLAHSYGFEPKRAKK